MIKIETQTYTTRFAAKRAATKKLGEGAFKITGADGAFSFEPVATDAESLPASRLNVRPHVATDGGPGIRRLRANRDAESLRLATLDDERRLAAIPASRDPGAPSAPAATPKTPEDAALAHDLAKAADVSVKAAAKRAAKALKPTDPAMIGDRLTGDAADMTISAISRFGKGQTAAPSAESLPFFMTAFAVDCLRKALASGKLADKGEVAARAALTALGAGVDPKAAPAASGPAKAASTAPKEGTTARGIFDMLRRDAGATAREMTDAGFKDVSCVSSAKQFAARFGLAVKVGKEGKFDRVWLVEKTADESTPTSAAA